MIKGLEALKIIKNELKFYYQDEWNITRYPKDIEVIEKELKALEIIKCLLFSKCRVYETSEKATATTITKGDYYVVELEFNNQRFYIGKEEYNLLKEVLNND